MRWLDEVAVLLRCGSGLEAVDWWTDGVRWIPAADGVTMMDEVAMWPATWVELVDVEGWGAGGVWTEGLD